MVLCQIYRTFVIPHSGDECRYIGFPGTLDETARQAIETADVIVEQFADFRAAADLDGLSTRARRMKVPVVGAPFLWPFAGSGHPESVSRYGRYDPFRPEMGDTYLNKLLLAGVTAEAAKQKYLVLDVPREVNLDRRYELLMESQRSRDQASGYRTADLIERYFRDEQLFLTPYHPTLRVSHYMAITFLEDLGAPTAAVENVRTLMTDSFYFRFALPIHPTVARHFKLSYVDENSLYPFHDEGPVSFADFVDRYVRCAANGALYDAMACVARGETEATQRLEQALVDSPRSALGWNLLARARILENRHAEAAPLLHKALAIDPGLQWAHFHLHQCHLRAGALDEAIAEVNAEIALRPSNPAIYQCLSQLLERTGRLQEAADALRHAVALAPRTLGKTLRWRMTRVRRRRIRLSGLISALSRSCGGSCSG
jgi:tetratricopeptide (TPR) repeat protein